MPSTEGGGGGGGGGGSAWSRCSHRHVLPLQRDMANRWKSCLELVDGEYGEFTLWLMASPMARMVLMESSPRLARMVLMESSPRPPRVSATIGMKVTPTVLICRRGQE